MKSLNKLWKLKKIVVITVPFSQGGTNAKAMKEIIAHAKPKGAVVVLESDVKAVRKQTKWLL